MWRYLKRSQANRQRVRQLEKGFIMTIISDELTPRLMVSNDSRITIGCRSYGRPKILLWQLEDRLDIGKFCSIADDVVILPGGEHNISWVTTYPLRFLFKDPLAGDDGHPTTRGPIVIGSDVWVGSYAIIVSGVTIGDGAVIGAGSVVSSDIPPYSIAAGNPARAIKKRFTEEQIEKLLEIRWWDWPEEKIKDAVPFLCSKDIDKFIEFAKDLRF